MDCQEVADLLNRLLSSVGPEAGLSLGVREETVFRDLVAKGCIAPVAAQVVDPAEMDRLKASLAETQRRESEVHKQVSMSRLHDVPEAHRREAVATLERLSAEEIALRGKVLELAERRSRLDGSVEVDGKRYTVTYKGKELLERLGPRIQRVGVSDIAEFETAIGRLKAAFGSRAEKAHAILSVVSPRLREIDEIHCRSASVGLAVREEDPRTIGAAYRTVFQALGPYAYSRTDPKAFFSMRSMIAENLCIAEPSLDAPVMEACVRAFDTHLSETASAGAASTDDAIRAALMLMPFRGWTQSVLQEAMMFSRAVAERGLPQRLGAAPELAAAVMVVGANPGGGAANVDLFCAYLDLLRTQGVGGSDLSFAAALLTVGGDPDVPAAVSRTMAVREYLTRFSENGMAVPAAMLSILSPRVEESLDNLRLASSEIARNRLSLGGMENLSLGMKLLLQIAISPNPVRGIVSPRGVFATPGARPAAPPVPGPMPAPEPEFKRVPPPAVPVGLLGVSLVVPIVFLPALFAFHDISLHRAAVSDWAFHPVHTAYVYG